MRIRATIVLALAFVTTLSRGAHAQRAEYAKPEELESEGLRHLQELAMLLEYAHVAEPEAVGDLEHVGRFDMRSRFYLGSVLAYASGFDGAIGASNEGVAYSATLFPLGVGTRIGASSVIALKGGIRYDAIGSELPRAFSVPVELTVSATLGPIRPIAWLRPAWVIAKEERKDGIATNLSDELEAGVLVRMGRQYDYWTRTSAGGGPAIGFTYRGFLDTHALGVLVGFDFAGAR
jgi:hypothetical protein